MDMEHFLDTEGTIGKGFGFSLFGSVHLTWLALTGVLVLFWCVRYRHLSEQGKDRWKKTVAVLLILDEVFKLTMLLVGGNFTKNYLPLHLCNINIMVIAFHAWRPNQVVGSFLYAICVPATMAALAFPGWETLPVLNFMHLHSFTLHMLLALYPIVLTVNGEIKTRAKDIPRCLMLLIGLAAVVYCVNVLLGTNYFYLMKAPKGNPLYWFYQKWGNHRLGFPFLVGAALLLMYIPVEINHFLKAHKKSLYIVK
jgi:hypothetical integral membrane protein (TIGR02206 family)